MAAFAWSLDLLSIIQAAGWPIWPLIICSVLGMALVIERFISLKTTKIVPPKLLEQFGRYDFGGLEADEALNHQGHSEDGADNQGPDGPTSGLYDGKQIKAPGKCRHPLAAQVRSPALWLRVLSPAALASTLCADQACPGPVAFGLLWFVFLPILWITL